MVSQPRLSKALSILREEGVRALAKRATIAASARMGVPSLRDRMERRRVELSEEIRRVAEGRVLHGPLKGFKIAASAKWDPGSTANMILGIYEQHVIEWIVNNNIDRRTLIDVGAADGYLGVGLVASGRFDRSLCFEITSEGQRLTQSVARQNGLEHKVVVRGEASVASLSLSFKEEDVDLADALIVMDIEGAEFSLLDDGMLRLLSQCVLVIELHEGYFEDGVERLALLCQRANTHFEHLTISQGARDPSSLPELTKYHDHERWLLCSEGRSIRQEWLVLKPRPPARD